MEGKTPPRESRTSAMYHEFLQNFLLLTKDSNPFPQVFSDLSGLYLIIFLLMNMLH